MSINAPFTRENLDFYLKELGKELRKLGGKMQPCEIILIGGASILANYEFRDMTYDMDAIISASSVMKDAVNRVGDKFGLPNGWLNTDFMKTKSYTPKLIEFSIYYKTFSGVLSIRTIAAEHLIAMKLKAGRRYKNDLSDVVGIVREHFTRGLPVTYKQIDKAICDLYGSWSGIMPESKAFLMSVLETPDNPELYEVYRESEVQAKDVLLDFQQRYPNVANEDNINSILEKAKQKKQSKNEPKR